MSVDFRTAFIVTIVIVIIFLSIIVVLTILLYNSNNDNNDNNDDVNNDKLVPSTTIYEDERCPELLQLLQDNSMIFQTLTNIAQKDGFIEGNIFTASQGDNDFAASLRVKQENLFQISRMAKTTIIEIGSNACHSMLIFLLGSKEDVDIVCFDSCSHHYTAECFKYIQTSFPNRKISLIIGDSSLTVPEFVKKNNNKDIDLCHIDGCHELRVARQDMINCINLNPDYIIFDDTDFDHLHDMCNEFVANGAIKKAPVLINSTYGSQHIVFSTI